jgi:hypothetical protein
LAVGCSPWAELDGLLPPFNATHESGENATRESQENSGVRPFGGAPGTFKPNENATHESGESAAREAQEGHRHGADPAVHIAEPPVRDDQNEIGR